MSSKCCTCDANNYPPDICWLCRFYVADARCITIQDGECVWVDIFPSGCRPPSSSILVDSVSSGFDYRGLENLVCSNGIPQNQSSYQQLQQQLGRQQRQVLIDQQNQQLCRHQREQQDLLQHQQRLVQQLADQMMISQQQE